MVCPMSESESGMMRVVLELRLEGKSTNLLDLEGESSVRVSFGPGKRA